MGRAKQEWIARTEGPEFTLYAVCRALGIPLGKQQAEFQDYLERRYRPDMGRIETQPCIDESGFSAGAGISDERDGRRRDGGMWISVI